MARPTSASAERGGFSEAKAQLERANYEVKDLTLAREAKVPDDAAVLLMAGPKADPFPQELEAIDAYLKRGGSVFVMLTPFQANGLHTYLAKYGFAVDDDLVVEVNPIARQFGFGPEVPVVTQYENHPITRDLGGLMTLFPLTRSLGAEPKPPRGVSVQPLALTSSQSWGETDRAALEKGEAKPDPQDKKGPLPVAAAATLDLQAETTADGAVRPAEAGKGPAAAAGGEARTAGARSGGRRRHRQPRHQSVPGRSGKPRLLPERRLLAGRAGRPAVGAAQGTDAAADHPHLGAGPDRVLAARGDPAARRHARRHRSGHPAPPRPLGFGRVSRKTLIALLVLLAGLGGFFVYDSYWLSPAREQRDQAKGRLWTVEPKDIEQIAIARKGETIRVKRVEGGWEMLAPVKARGDRGTADEAGHEPRHPAHGP